MRKPKLKPKTNDDNKNDNLDINESGKVIPKTVRKEYKIFLHVNEYEKLKIIASLNKLLNNGQPTSAADYIRRMISEEVSKSDNKKLLDQFT